MLEAVSPTELAARLGFGSDGGRPRRASIADAARRCIAAWGRPSRQRVSAYLHRQLAALQFEEELAREEVRTVLDGLIEIGDLAQVRLDGKSSLVFARPSIVSTSDVEHVLLGAHSHHASSEATGRNRIVRRLQVAAEELSPVAERLDFEAWIGPGAYLDHHRRRTRVQETVSLGEFWTCLTEALTRDGGPIDTSRVRILAHPPGWRSGFFGRHDAESLEGRWSAALPDGVWCAVRPGRNEYEWHPILISPLGEQARALDLYDWDEWNWALLARGVALDAPERMRFEVERIASEHRIPSQFRKALLLLGEPAGQAWTWKLSPAGVARFRQWRDGVLSA